MSAATFDTFVPGRELQLVARHARAGDAPDERRVDAEVLERLHERVADAVGDGGIRLPVRLRPVQDVSLREDVLGVLGDLGDVEERRRILLEVIGLDEQRLRLGADDVRELVHRVERRLGPRRARRRRRRRHGLHRTALRRGAHRVTGAPDERAGRRTREEQAADDEREDPEDRRARAKQCAEAAAEDPAEEPAMRSAERRQDAESQEGEPDAEGPEVDQLAARHHECADGDESERHEIRGRAHQAVDAVGERAADDPAVPAAVEHDAEEDAGGDEAEAPELRVVPVRPAARALAPCPALHA